MTHNCRSCMAPIGPDDKFCGACGTPVSKDQSTAIAANGLALSSWRLLLARIALFILAGVGGWLLVGLIMDALGDVQIEALSGEAGTFEYKLFWSVLFAASTGFVSYLLFVASKRSGLALFLTTLGWAQATLPVLIGWLVLFYLVV